MDVGATAVAQDEPDSQEDAGPIRDEVVQRALRALLEDAERCEGTLRRVDIDRTYVKKGLTVSECEQVESGLREHQITVNEDDDEEESAVPASDGQARTRRKYLTEQEERDYGRKIQLAARIAAEGTNDGEFAIRVSRDAQHAKVQFVESNIRYVWKLANQIGPKQHLAIDDLFQEGMTGLLRATDLYDPERGFRFKTYATWWIRQKMHRAIANDDRTVRLPVYVRQNLSRIRRAERQLGSELGRAPTDRELANALGTEPERLAQFLWRVQETACVEADAPIGDGDDTIISGLSDSSTPSAFDIVAQRELRENLKELLSSLLSPREEHILRMRFGLDGRDSHTLQTIGDSYRITRERVRQIEAKALRKLRHAAHRRLLRYYFDEPFGG